MLVARFGFALNAAGDLVMGYYLISALTGPFVGWIIEKYGKRTKLMLWMTTLLLLTNILFAFLDDGSPENPNYAIIIPLFGITVFSAFYTILIFPCLPLIVEKKVVGTATGLMTCCSNLTQTVLPIILGVIHDYTEDFHFGYFWTAVTVSFLVAVGLILDYWVHREDQKNGGQLDNLVLKKKSEEEKGRQTGIKL